MLVYADTSALVKLILLEAESSALQAWYEQFQVRTVTCELTRTELRRAVRRQNMQFESEVEATFEKIGFIPLDHSVYDEAGEMSPIELCSLDAIHLTAARLVKSQIAGMLTYDDRLAEAARAIGIRTFSPA